MKLVHLYLVALISLSSCLQIIAQQPRSVLDRLKSAIESYRNDNDPDFQRVFSLLDREVEQHLYKTAIVNYRYPRSQKTVLHTVLKCHETRALSREERGNLIGASLPLIQRLVAMGALPDSECLIACSYRTSPSAYPVIDFLLQTGVAV